jgi:hypothetical protein
VANYNTPLAQSAGRTLTYFDHYTYIFAVNSGMVDANVAGGKRGHRDHRGHRLQLVQRGDRAAPGGAGHGRGPELGYKVASHTL